MNWLSSFFWHHTSLKQQLSQREDDYKILTLEIYNYELVVVHSLVQHISKTTVEPKRGRLPVCSCKEKVISHKTNLLSYSSVYTYVYFHFKIK